MSYGAELTAYPGISSLKAEISKRVSDATGGCATKIYLISSVALLILAALVATSCFNIDFPSTLIKTLKEVPLISSAMVILCGVAVTVWGVSKNSEEKLPNLNEPGALFYHASGLESKYLFGNDPTKGDRIALAVGPLFILIGLSTIIALNIPSMTWYHIPGKVLVAGALVAIAARFFTFRYIRLNIENRIAAQIEKKYIEQVAQLYQEEILASNFNRHRHHLCSND